MGNGQSKIFAAILILTVSFSSLALSTTGVAFAQQSSGDWPMFLANPSHTGVGTGSAVIASKLLWKSNVTFIAPQSAIENGLAGIDTSWSSPAIVNGVVYVCAGTSVRTESGYGGASWGDVFALNATSGTIIWDYRDNSSSGAIGPSPAVVNGVVFYGFDLSNIGALNASDGVSLWNYTAAEGRFSSPTVVGGVVYIGLTVPSASTVLDGTSIVPFNLFAINATSGYEIWSYNFTKYSYCYSSPAVVNGVVYVGSGGAGPNAGGNVYALNAADGAELWSYPISWTPNYSDSWVDSSPAVANGMVYVGCHNGNVYALNAGGGYKIWNYTTNGKIEGSPVVSDGNVYISSEDGNIYALNAENGAKLWSFQTGGVIDSSPAVVDGVVYVDQNYLGVLYSLNAYTGEMLSNYTISAGIVSASPAVVNGVVYVGSTNNGGTIGQVYALSGSIISPTSTNTLPIVLVGVVAVVVVITVAVVFMFRKRLKRAPS